MMHAHALENGARYFPERPAFSSATTRVTFRELNARVTRIAVALSQRGFVAGDRLALLLPNGLEYLELLYACAWLGVIAVPLNTRFSRVEIDRVLSDASPQGLSRHSSLAVPTVPTKWQVVLDQEPLIPDEGSPPQAI